MAIKFLRFFINFISKISLKTRFVSILILNSLVTFVLVGIVIYYNMNSLHDNKIRNGIQSTLNSICINIDNAYRSLNSISKQFAYEDSILVEGGIEEDLKEYIHYLDADSSFTNEQILHFARVSTRMQKKITFITSTNPTVGLTLLYRQNQGGGKQLLFSNADNLSSEINKPLPVALINTDYVTYFGIHPSLNNDRDQVISIQRKIEIPDTDDFYIYMEVDDRWLDDLLTDETYGMNAAFIMTDTENKVIYSEVPMSFPVGSIINIDIKPNRSGVYNDYYIFNGPQQSGWRIMEVIEKSAYNKEIVKVMSLLLILFLISLIAAIGMAFIIWRSIYRPINAFRKEFRLLANNQLNSKIRRTRIKEFDELLLLYYKARGNNALLLDKIKMKERKQQALEVEKLLIQINPHFIYNTLNSIQWMARLNHQKDIEKMTTLFSRVLHYNLGKGDIIVTVSEELNAINDYIELQKMRLEFHLDFILHVQQSVKERRIPRFILQPLVENAIFHGINENGTIIRMNISQEKEKLRIQVVDNGKGMSVNDIEKISMEYEKVNRRNGMGIGLKYVNGMLRHYYGEHYGVQIKSEIGKGTMVTMLLPLDIKEME